jgi:hypothetical protein
MPNASSTPQYEHDQRRQMAGRDRAQHGSLAEPVHQPALRDRSERVGEAERAEDPAGLGERPGRVAREQQDTEAEHADRHRSRDRQEHGRAGARQGQQRPVATHGRILAEGPGRCEGPRRRL